MERLAVTRSVFPAGHVVHMTTDHDYQSAQSFTVASCDCGWVSRLPWPGSTAAQDAAIEAHWHQIETA